MEDSPQPAAEHAIHTRGGQSFERTDAGIWKMILKIQSWVRLVAIIQWNPWYAHTRRRRQSSPSRIFYRLGRRLGYRQQVLEASHFLGSSGPGLIVQSVESTTNKLNTCMRRDIASKRRAISACPASTPRPFLPRGVGGQVWLVLAALLLKTRLQPSRRKLVIAFPWWLKTWQGTARRASSCYTEDKSLSKKELARPLLCCPWETSPRTNV